MQILIQEKNNWGRETSDEANKAARGASKQVIQIDLLSSMSLDLIGTWPCLMNMQQTGGMEG